MAGPAVSPGRGIPRAIAFGGIDVVGAGNADGDVVGRGRIDLADGKLAPGVGDVVAEGRRVAPVIDRGIGEVGLIELDGAACDDEHAYGGGWLQRPACRGLLGGGTHLGVIGSHRRDVGEVGTVDDVKGAVGTADELPHHAVRAGLAVAGQPHAGTITVHIATATQRRAEAVPVLLDIGAGSRQDRALSAADLLKEFVGGIEALHLGGALVGRELTAEGMLDVGHLLHERFGQQLVVIAGLGAYDLGDQMAQLGDARRECLSLLVEYLPGRIDESVEGMTALGVGDDEGEHPLVQPHIRGADVRQLHEHFVPALLEGDGNGRTGGGILVAEGSLVGDALAGVLPLRTGQLDIVQPDARPLAVPLSVGRGEVFLGARIVLELDDGTCLLLAGRIDVGPGIGGGVELRIGVIARHDGSPDVAQVDAGSRGTARAVGLAEVGVAVARALGLGGQHEGGIAAIGEGIGDLPTDIGLADVGDGL